MRKKATLVLLLSVTIILNCSNVLAKDESVGLQIEMLPWEKVYKLIPEVQ